MNNNDELFFRNHFTYIIEKSWGTIFLIVLIVVQNIQSLSEIKVVVKEVGERKDIFENFLYVFIFLGLFAIYTAWFVNKWYKTTITIKNGMLTYQKKTLSNKINTMSIDKISNINIEQNLFEIIFRTCKMKIDTNSMSTADTTDLVMILKKSKGEEIRKIILQMKSGIVEEDKIDSEVSGNLLLKYTIKEVLRDGILSINFIQLILLLISVVFGSIAIASEKSDDYMAGLVTELIIVIPILWSIISNMEKSFNYEMRREGDKIYISCGLWRKKNYTVPLEKINGVTVIYPLIGRFMKSGYVKLINVGGEGEESNGIKMLLFEKTEDIKMHLQILLPEYYVDIDKLQNRAPKKYMTIRTISSLLLSLAVGVLFNIVFLVMAEGIDKYVIFGSIAAMFACLVITESLAFLVSKTIGVSLFENKLMISHGMFEKKMIIIPYKKIQYICVNKGILERIFNLSHGYVAMLASTLSRFNSFGCIEKETLEKIEKKIRETY